MIGIGSAMRNEYADKGRTTDYGTRSDGERGKGEEG